METFANILQWGGAALVGLAVYIMVDRGRGEEVLPKVFGITGFLAMSADSLVDGARRSREGLCFSYDVDPETLETTATPCPTEPVAVGSVVVESIKDFAVNLLLAGFAIGVALLVAWVMARRGRRDAH